jgi:hypothetical protein
MRPSERRIAKWKLILWVSLLCSSLVGILYLNFHLKNYVPAKKDCEKVINLFGYHMGYYYIDANRDYVKDAKSHQKSLFEIVLKYPYCFPDNIVSSVSMASAGG